MSTARYTVEARVGKLIEARVFRLVTSEDAIEYGRAVANALRTVSRMPVLCADHRPVVIYPQAAADALIELFRPNNARFERIAILVAPTNATLLMQLERIVRESGFARRKVFRTADGAIEHMAPSLDANEIVRARAFVAEHTDAR